MLAGRLVSLLSLETDHLDDDGAHALGTVLPELAGAHGETSGLHRDDVAARKSAVGQQILVGDSELTLDLVEQPHGLPFLMAITVLRNGVASQSYLL